MSEREERNDEEDAADHRHSSVGGRSTSKDEGDDRDDDDDARTFSREKDAMSLGWTKGGEKDDTRMRCSRKNTGLN